MRLHLNIRCDTCKDRDRAGCVEVQRAYREIDRVLAEVEGRAARHGANLPPVEFYAQVPCWYSARKWKREQGGSV